MKPAGFGRETRELVTLIGIGFLVGTVAMLLMAG